jgi:hypothetical protein
MAKRIAVQEASIDEQREMTSADLPLAAAVTSTTHVARVNGRTAAVGELEAGRARGRSQDPRYDSLVESMRNRHDATGIRPATVLNFLPLPLTVNSPMHSLRVQIPPCYGTKEFTAHTWEEADIQVLYAGEGINQPWDYMPIQLARAFEAEYRLQGGVIAFTGSLDDVDRPDVVKQIDAAKVASYAWMHGKIEEGNAEWNSPNRQNARNITSLHRDCAQKLFDLKLLTYLPEWIQTVRRPEDIPKGCQGCGATPEHNAVKCVKCNYIIDPAKAFSIGMINEESESLERLPRSVVEELGVSAYVAETSDERPERLQAGLPKPLSIAAHRAFEAQQQVEAHRQKKA